MRKELLRMDHITVCGGGKTILDNLNFQMYSGEIMGLLASDNKGYDTLIDHICCNNGIDIGSVWFLGRIVNSYSHSDGSANNVCVIEQKSHLIKSLSIADNLFVMRRGFKKYLINEKMLCQQSVRFLRENSLVVDIDKKVSSLTALERFKIELAKALLASCRLIIIRNPANYLSQHEMPEFQGILRKICDDGISVLYISNHHQELFKIADHVSLFATGRIIKVFDQDEMTDKSMQPYITDFSKAKSVYTNEESSDEGSVLHFHNVYAGQLTGLDFCLHKSEVLTILDMDNRIFDDFQSIMTGEMECESGYITAFHKLYKRKMAKDYIGCGIGLIPEDSVSTLLYNEKSYMENLTFFLDRKIGRSIVGRNVMKSIYNEYRPTVGSAIDAPIVQNLPFNEKIALVYYRYHILKPGILICMQPLARGDMYDRMEVVRLIQLCRDSGISVLICTTSVSDTLEVSDRLIVVENGCMKTEYGKDKFSEISK